MPTETPYEMSRFELDAMRMPIQSCETREASACRR
jgi:hypothetical protein